MHGLQPDDQQVHQLHLYAHQPERRLSGHPRITLRFLRSHLLFSQPRRSEVLVHAPRAEHEQLLPGLRRVQFQSRLPMRRCLHHLWRLLPGPSCPVLAFYRQVLVRPVLRHQQELLLEVLRLGAPTIA